MAKDTRQPVWTATVLTLFPEMFPGPLGLSLAGRALAGGVWALETVDIRDFARDKHASVDDVPFGAVTGRVTLLYRGTELADAVFEPGTVRRGAATLGGALREVLLVDGDADGAYDGPADRWIALRRERKTSRQFLARSRLAVV